MSAASQISWDNPHGISWDDDPLKTGKGMEDAAHNQARPTTLPGGGQPSYTALALQNSPSGADPHNPGNPNLNAVPESEREGVNDSAFDTALATAPLVGPAGRAAAEGAPGLMRLGRTVIGGTVGAGIGGTTGASLGGVLGETGRRVGGVVGSLAGGAVGGGLANGLERLPATSAQSMRGEPGAVKPLPFGIQRFIPEAMVPKGEPGSLTNPGPFSNLPARVSPPRATPDDLTLAVREGRAARLPVRMPTQLPTTTPSGIPIDQKVAGTRSLILTPSEAASEDVMQRIAKTRASQRGMQFAAGMTPREGRSVPRLPARLPEAEYPGPRERVPLLGAGEDDDDE